MKSSQNLTQQIQDLEKKARVSQETLQQNEVALEALKRSQSQVRGDIERQTAKLLSERDLELSERIEEAQKALDSLIGRIKTQKTLAERYEMSVAELAKQAVMIEQQLEPLRLEYKALQAHNRELTELNTAAKLEYELIIPQISDKLAEKDGLVKENERLISSSNELLQARIVAEDDHRTLMSQMNVEADEKNRKLAMIEHKLVQTTNLVLQEQKSLDSERRELAERKMTLDKLDQSIRLRTKKVEMSEDAVARNASLLDL